MGASCTSSSTATGRGHFEALQLLPPTRLEPMFDEEGRAIHAVRRCQSVCIRMVCHRDVNACLNIMYVFIYEWINGSPWRLHQGISAAAASRLGARAFRLVCGL